MPRKQRTTAWTQDDEDEFFAKLGTHAPELKVDRDILRSQYVKAWRKRYYGYDGKELSHVIPKLH